MRAAALALRAREPAKLVIAVPVAPKQVCGELRAFADEVVCLDTLRSFRSVGSAYDDFSQTRDAEVCDLLARAPRAPSGAWRLTASSARRLPGTSRCPAACSGRKSSRWPSTSRRCPTAATRISATSSSSRAAMPPASPT